MTPSPDGLLPDNVAADLLERWTEPHRDYHGVSHLVDGLRALEELGGSRLELIAFWFHDAIHSNRTPDDEQASADLVRELLDGHETDEDIHEVARLVLLTAGHRTTAADGGGQRLCDADLSGLGANASRYRRNVEGIRAELPHLTDDEWMTGRTAFLAAFLQREHLFATPHGRDLWEDLARRNLNEELRDLRSRRPTNLQ